MKVEAFEYPENVVAYMAGDNPTPEETHQRLVKHCERVHREFDELLPWLPEKVGSILDIGAGVAGVDALLARHYGPPIEITLIDGDGTGERQNGFGEIKPWADRRIGVAFVKANTPAAGVRVSAHAPNPLATFPADLIISLKSWGHHYPISVYLEMVKRSLNPGGRLILDIRRGTDGSLALSVAGFRHLGEVGGTKKCVRLAYSLLDG